MESTLSFPKMEDVVPLSAADQPCFDELRQVLAKHNALNRFGICLLHEHFPIGDGEILIEDVDEKTRTMTIRPEKAENINGPVLQTVWYLGDPKDPKVISTQNCIQGCKWETGSDGKKEHVTTHKRGG